ILLVIEGAAKGCIGDVFVFLSLFLEGIGDAEARDMWADAERIADKLPEFRLRIEFLERPPACDEAVLEGNTLIERLIDAHGDNKRPSRQRISLAQRFAALRRVFDNVQDIAEVDDIGGLYFRIRLEIWV